MKEARRIHFIGIGGTGLSAIARVLHESGYQVSGSDRSLSPLAKALKAEGVRVSIGHQAENVEGAQVVVRSSAIPDDNVEVMAAKAKGVPVLKRSEFLSQLMEGHYGIAVAGTHGKTTTTAMIAWMLTALGQDPSFIAGGVSKNMKTNAHAGKGKPFVIEADEYDHMFMGLTPQLAVITNIEHDHPDCYPTAEDYFTAFNEFATQMGSDGTLLVCANDPGAARIGQAAKDRKQKVLAYAVREAKSQTYLGPASYVADMLTLNADGGQKFDVYCTLAGKKFELHPATSLRVPGKHNVQNALAALAVAHQMNLSVEQAGQALAEFTGTGRRFEVHGAVRGITVIDDYAHHPTQIKATIAAARTRYSNGQVWVVWQPHTYSRTRALLEAFVMAFEQADHVLVTEIYAAREKPPRDGFSSQQVVAAMKHVDVRYTADFSQIAEILAKALAPGDVLLVLSAGDADQVSDKVLAQLRERSN